MSDGSSALPPELTWVAAPSPGNGEQYWLRRAVVPTRCTEAELKPVDSPPESPRQPFLANARSKATGPPKRRPAEFAGRGGGGGPRGGGVPPRGRRRKSHGQGRLPNGKMQGRNQRYITNTAISVDSLSHPALSRPIAFT